MSHACQSSIFLVIFTLWIALLYIRIFDKTLKKYTLGIGICLIFWMILKIIRPFTEGNVSTFMWYLYYIPMIFIPVFYYNASAYLRKYKQSNINKITIVVSFLLVLLVATNNLHQSVFKIIDGDSIYTHEWGYYLICIWIFLLLIMAVKILVQINSKQKEKNKIIIMPFIPIILGLVYTIIYILDIGNIRHTNLAIIIGILFCIGLEILFRLSLIPNNFRYKKIFLNSNLPIEIVSKNGVKEFNTNHYIKICDNAYKDIRNNKAKEKYKLKNKIQTIKQIYGGYAIEEEDLSKINKLKENIQAKKGELLKQEKVLKFQKKLTSELYEVRVKNEITELLDEKIDEKRKQINKILDKMEEKDIEKICKIKILSSYCKRMSSLVISNYNQEKYNNKRIETIINELFSEIKIFKLSGVVQTNMFVITSNDTITIYDIIFETIIDLKDVNFVLNIKVDSKFIILKFLFDKKLKNLKQKIEKLKIEEITTIEEKNDEDATKLEVVILRREGL